MLEGVAIKVDHVSKSFKLPHERVTSIKSAVVNFYKRKRSYELQEALKDVSFEVKKGEFFGIVGRNGSGKSTLLKLLAGIYAPTAGEVHVRGKLTPFIELGVGFNPELTGRENIYLNGALLGFNRDEMNEMYDDIVNFAELHEFMGQRLKNYSSGMQVRLAFSIAIRAQTEILLLDEVLAVGDAAFQNKCINYFKKVKKEGKTVVFVSHDMSSIGRFCDRVLVMDKGNVDGIYDAEVGVRRYEDFNLRSELKDLQSELREDSESAGHKHESKTKQDVVRSLSITSVSKSGTINLGSDLVGVIDLNSDVLKRRLTKNSKFSVAVNIYNRDGVLAASLETPQEYYSRDIHKIEFNVSNIPLTPGLYTAYVGIYAKDTDGSILSVSSSKSPTSFGIESGGRLFSSQGITQLTTEWKSDTSTVIARNNDS